MGNEDEYGVALTSGLLKEYRSLFKCQLLLFLFVLLQSFKTALRPDLNIICIFKPKHIKYSPLWSQQMCFYFAHYDLL